MVKSLGPMKRLVKTDLRVLEPTQMEASFQYRLMVKGDGEDVIYPHRYQIESYFFFPQQMKITPASYPLEFFYRDVKSYLNFRIPKLTFKEIMGFVENAERSPLLKIRVELVRSESGTGESKQKFLEQEAKIFACSFHTFIMRKSKKIAASLAMLNESESSEIRARAVVERSLHKISVIFQEWQKVCRETEQAMPSLTNEFRKIDEYIVHNLHDFLLRTQKRMDGSASFHKTLRFAIRFRLRALRMHSRQQGYAWVDASSDELLLENYLHHRGYLKRKVWSALYLDTRTKPLFGIQRQTGAMVAAGIAGAWAAFANILIIANGMGDPNSPTLGFSTFILITILTLAYILKDRIKELGRGYFKGGLFGDLPDSSSKVIYDASGEKEGQLEVGVHEEKVAYVDVDKLPSDLHAVIQEFAPERLDAEHKTVICYRKRLNLEGEKIRILKRKIRAIYTFFRLNVSSFLAPLDMPFEELPLANARLHATARRVPKVYHLDLALRMTAFGGGEQRAALEYYRLVVTKAGIKRIDLLMADHGEDDDEEDEEGTEG